MAGLAVPSAYGSLHGLAATVTAGTTSAITAIFATATATASAPLQIDGETVAIAVLGAIAVLALLYFAVKFAAGFREYLQVRRRDAADGRESDVDREIDDSRENDNGDPDDTR